MQKVGEALLAVGDGFPGDGGVVGDDSVDAHFEKIACQLQIVDGVDPDAEAAFVGFFDGFGGDLAVPADDLGAGFFDAVEEIVVEDAFFGGEAASVEGAGRAESAEDGVFVDFAAVGDEVPVEGLDDDVVEDFLFAEEIDEGLGVAVFTFDEGDASALDDVEGFVESWDMGAGVDRGEPGAGVELLEFGEGFGDGGNFGLSESFSGVSRSVEGAVVKDEGDSVAAVIVIELDEIGLGEDSGFEGGNGVFGGGHFVAAVGDDEGAFEGHEVLHAFGRGIVGGGGGERRGEGDSGGHEEVFDHPGIYGNGGGMVKGKVE